MGSDVTILPTERRRWTSQRVERGEGSAASGAVTISPTSPVEEGEEQQVGDVEMHQRRDRVVPISAQSLGPH